MKNFEQEFSRFVRAMPQAAEKGLAAAGMLLLRDAVMDVPKVPHDEGTLRGSGSVHVNGKLIATSADQGDGKGTPADADNTPRVPGAIVATVGFNTPYAARLHEHPEFEFTEEGTGAKFLEAKAIGNADAYMREAVDVMRGELNR